jgi:hypothetical protein
MGFKNDTRHRTNIIAGIQFEKDSLALFLNNIKGGIVCLSIHKDVKH